jgi:SAM-dependent methyltransferase
MELIFCEEEWHNILLQTVDRRQHSSEIADADFYKTFYETFDDNGGSLSPEWLDRKTNISQWIEKTFLQLPAGMNKDSFKILSLGVGLGIIEEPWIRKGFQVHLQECQEVSLKRLRSKFQTVPIHIGDARSVNAPGGQYSLVIFSALDYVFDRKGYRELLQEVRRLLNPEGKAVCVCVSNLGFKAMIFSLIKKLISHRNKESVIPWGYHRTVGEHIRSGKKAGLTAEKVYIFDNHLHPIGVRRSRVFMSLPTLKSVSIAIEWSKAGRKEQA